MPYSSEAQRKYFNANRKKLEEQGVDVKEWNDSSKGLELPSKVKDKSKIKKVSFLPKSVNDLPWRDRVELFALDKDNKVLGGYYEQDKTHGVFGGGIDGDNPEEAAAREFKEESGWPVENVRMLPIDPVQHEWKPPYASAAQAERAKQFRGSRTLFAAGDIPADATYEEPIDPSGLRNIKFRRLVDAMRGTRVDRAYSPETAEARRAAIKYLIKERIARRQKMGSYNEKMEKVSFLPSLPLGLLQAKNLLSVPRPWELTPGTSILKQFVTGSGPLKERARMGLAQSLGRYATNLREPFGYEMPSISELVKGIPSVIRDKPPWLDPNKTFTEGDTVAKSREVLYRDLFDLPSRVPVQGSGLTQIGSKKYQFDSSVQGSTKPLANKRLPGQGGQGWHPVIGGLYVHPDGSFNDTWDLISPEDKDGVRGKKFQDSHGVRKITEPILRPPSVLGRVNN